MEGNTNQNLYLAQVKLFRHHRTDKAVLMSVNDDKDTAVWIPVSHIASMIPAGRRYQFRVTVPEWLATKKKLL